MEFAILILPSFTDLSEVLSHASSLLRLSISIPPPRTPSKSFNVSPFAPFAAIPSASETEGGDTSEFLPFFTVFLKSFTEKSACAFIKSVFSPSFPIAVTGCAVIPSIKFSFALTVWGFIPGSITNTQTKIAATADGTAHLSIRRALLCFLVCRLSRIFSAVSCLNFSVVFIFSHSRIYFSLLFIIKTS